MTRKSPKKALAHRCFVANPLRVRTGDAKWLTGSMTGSRTHLVRLRQTCLLFVVCVLSLPGCATFSPRAGSLKDMEDARRKIEPGDEAGVYRPEGRLAEKSTKPLAVIDRWMGKKRTNIPKARENYHAGDELFNKAAKLEGQDRLDAFHAAALKYQAAAKNWPSSALEQDALLMMGESYFFAEEYYRSEQAYAKLVKEYPRNRYMDYVGARRFEIADYWLKKDGEKHNPFYVVNFTDKRFPLNDTRGHGKRVLEKMRLDDPTGKHTDDATMRLAVASFQRGDYESAADTFADVRMTYPDSEHQFNAQFLELQSLMASYQGAQYSSLPLTDAEKRVKQIARQFPKEAAEKQGELNQAYAKIRYLKAERCWVQAEFRRKRQENESARYYLRQIISDYGDTPFAEEAKATLERLKDAPDDPPQYFAPLVKLFPERGAERPWMQTTGDSQ